MNFSEYKKLLGADPYSQDPEFLRARNANQEYRQAAAEADDFERKLQQALAVNPGEEFLARLQQVTDITPQRRGFSGWRLALAASVLMAFGAVLVFGWQQNRVSSIEQYVASHWASNHSESMHQAHGPVTLDQIQKIMAAVDMGSSEELNARVLSIMNCPTPGGKGVHIVLATDIGPVTVFYMPKTEIKLPAEMSVDGKTVRLVAMERGSAALIGESMDQLKQLEPVVREGIFQGSIDL